MSELTPAGSTRRWRRTRLFVLGRDGYRCRVPDPSTGIVCGRRLVGPAGPGLPAHVDHIVRRRHGGTDAPDNLRAACEPCNLERERLDAEPATVAELAGLARSWGWSW